MSMYSFYHRYIKELAERVNRLENSGATPPEMQYAPVHHDPSGAGSVYTPPLDYTRKRNHGMMVGPQIFEQDHHDLQDFAAGHRGTTTDIATQAHQGPRVLHSPTLIPYQNRDTLNNIASEPSVDRSVRKTGWFHDFPDLFTVIASSSNLFSLCLHARKAGCTTNLRKYLILFVQPCSMHAI